MQSYQVTITMHQHVCCKKIWSYSLYYYRVFVISMADVQCSLMNKDNSTIIIANLIHAGISFLSFLISVPVVLLNVIVYMRRRVAIEHMEGLFMTLSIFLLLLTLDESFQWVLFCSSVGCAVVGFIREYCLIALLANTLCISIHLLLQMCQPKCLQVIDEVRKRRSKITAIVYLVCAIVTPLLFVFWPFLTGGYGKDYSYCWILNDDGASWIVRIVLWHAWALVICVFTLLVSLIVIRRLCLRAANCNGDIFTLILLMLGLLYAVIMNVLSLVTSIQYFTSAGSLVFMIATIVLLSRNVYNICYKRPYGTRLVGTKRSTYKSTYSKSTTTLIETA